MTQNDTKETLARYRQFAANPWFDPDGMCLMICRDMRGIGPRFPSAVSAQVNTPEQYRVRKIDDVKRGMVMFFDDPHDSNPYGHIVTAVGRDKGGQLNVWTNSVVANQMRIVPWDFFKEHWGDSFQFAATWLNGVELDLPEKKKPKPVPPLRDSVSRMKATVVSLSEGIGQMQRSLNKSKRDGETRLVNALERDLTRMVKSRDHVKELLRNYS